MVVKYCGVPSCKNNSTNNPDKIFIRIPQPLDLKEKWYKAMNEPRILRGSNAHVCEDHFNLKEDMDNYYEVQLMGNSIKKRMKRHVVPHLALGPTNKNLEPATSSDSRLDPLDISKPSTSSNQENTAKISVSSDNLIDPLDISQTITSDDQETPMAISVPANVPIDPLEISPRSTSNRQENVMKMSVPPISILPKTQPVKPPTLITSVKNNVTLVQPASLAPNKKYILVPVQTFNSTEFQRTHFPSPNNTNNLRFVLQPQNPANILLNTNSNGTICAESLPRVPSIPTPCTMIAANSPMQEISDESILPDISYGSKTIEEVQIKQEVPDPDDSQVTQEENRIEDNSSTSTSDNCDFTVPLSESRELTEFMHSYSKSAYKSEELDKLMSDVRNQMRVQKQKEKRLKRRIWRLVGEVHNLKQSKANSKCYYAAA